MFDRSKVPRMPWHDVGLQIVGQPARDLCRHFVQRWNLLIRNKNHSRPMPFLLPPSDFTELELKSLGLAGTCEIQICRSCGPWSMGTVNKVEHSIQNAYLKGVYFAWVKASSNLCVCSHSTLRALCLYREPVLYHLYSSRWRRDRESNR